MVVRVRECVCVCVCVCVCLCERERVRRGKKLLWLWSQTFWTQQRKNFSLRIWLYVWECVCVFVWEREREWREEKKLFLVSNSRSQAFWTQQLKKNFPLWLTWHTLQLSVLSGDGEGVARLQEELPLCHLLKQWLSYVCVCTIKRGREKDEIECKWCFRCRTIAMCTYTYIHVRQ